MQQLSPSLPPGMPDPVLLRRTLFVQRACLGAVALVSIAAFGVWLSAPLQDSLSAYAVHVSLPIVVTALLCAFSLLLAEPGNSPLLTAVSRYIALLAAIIAVSVLFESVLHISPAIDSLLDTARPRGASLPAEPAASFTFLAVVIILVSSVHPLMRRIADFFVSGLFLLVLILIAEELFVGLGLFGLTMSGLISPVSLCCLVPLSVVVTLRQMEHGPFMIFLGRGIGSRIARGFAPVLVLLPLVAELVRTRVELREVIPTQYAAAILTSTIAGLALVLLLFLVWRINTMEQSIHDLTLRDELTGLYNMRGFYLLAEQTLRLAQRANLPFSVLFIDLDGLKQINDQLGHNTGSAYLAETGELVDATFREGDVKGRFGGDEFVIAGQFSRVGMEIAVQRLQMAAAERNARNKRKLPLSFSIGHVTCDHFSQESLKDLVTRADEAMYRDKRSKKVQRK